MSKDLGVGWQPQERVYFCGPAVAQMALTSLGAGRPWPASNLAGAALGRDPDRDQREASFVGRRRRVSLPPFPEQKCDRYEGDWFCWSTTPDALSGCSHAAEQGELRRERSRVRARCHRRAAAMRR